MEVRKNLMKISKILIWIFMILYEQFAFYLTFIMSIFSVSMEENADMAGVLKIFGFSFVYILFGSLIDILPLIIILVLYIISRKDAKNFVIFMIAMDFFEFIICCIILLFMP